MTQARVRVDPALAALTRSEWERLIYEANLGAENAEIAHRYFVNRECEIDIAIDKNTDRAQISRRVGQMRRRLEDVYKKIPS